MSSRLFNEDIALSEVDHRLDAETHAVFDNRSGALASVVGHFGVFVHLAAYAVSAHFAYYRVSVAFAVGLDGVGDVADAVADLAGCDAFVERLFGHFQQAAGRGCDVADGEGVALVAVVSVEFDYGVDAYYVAFAECIVAREAVDDCLVYLYAEGGGKAGVAQTGRTAAVIEHIFARNCIELECSDTGSHPLGNFTKCATHQITCFSHF